MERQTPMKGTGVVVRILIAAKDPEQCAQMRAALAPDFECEVFHTAAAAIERIMATDDFHVVLCDLTLEDARGLDLFWAVRALRPEVCHRIIFVSGCPYGDPSEEVLASLKNWVLYKPFDDETLRLMIERRVNLRSLGRGRRES